MTSTVTRKGECEVCSDGAEVVLYCAKGNIWMCSTHKAEDDALTTANAKAVIITSQKVDSTIQLKADIWNTTTTSFTELQGAILANGEIPADKKNETLLAEVAARIAVLDAAIFQQKAELADNQNKRNSLLTNAQQIHARLRANEQAKFKQFDVSYKPAPAPKAKGPVKTTGAKKVKYSMTLVRQMADKYGVPASSVQSLIVSRNLNPEDAAKHLYDMLNKA